MTQLVGGTITTRLFQQRQHDQLMNMLNRNLMETLRDQFLPFHFMGSAFSRYPGVFAARSQKWRQIKRRVVHHDRPNEWTGALKAEVLSGNPRQITATKDRATFRAKAPMDSKILSGPKAGQTIRRPLTEQRRKEMEVVADQEIGLLKDRQAGQYVAAVYHPEWNVFALRKYRF